MNKLLITFSLCIIALLLSACGDDIFRSGGVFRDCDVCPDMVLVPAGRYSMGSPAPEEARADDESPVHQVTIAEPFAVGIHEVTRGEYRRFVEETGYRAGDICTTYEDGKLEKRSGRSWLNPGYQQEDSHPVVCVSWGDAQAYAEWLRRKTGKGYRLLSEAEWEYAAHGGLQTMRYWGAPASAQCLHSNAADVAFKHRYPDWKRGTIAACDDGYVHTSPVGHYRPNGYGLHDVLGNVWEWVEDWSWKK